jgi:hypothetical protein
VAGDGSGAGGGSAWERFLSCFFKRFFKGTTPPPCPSPRARGHNIEKEEIRAMLSKRRCMEYYTLKIKKCVLLTFYKIMYMIILWK